jgi:uncharacterized protein (TIGR00251 family)
VPVAERTRSPIRLHVRVVPGATTTQVVGRLGEAWKLRVHAAPERGRANEEVVVLLAETLGLPRADVRVVAGHTRRDKVVELGGISRDEAERRLESVRKDAA